MREIIIKKDMKKKALFTAVLALAAAPLFESGAQAQIVMTMEQALEYSAQNNPDLINSRMSMERYEQNLIAQRASLKSRFSLNLQPVIIGYLQHISAHYLDRCYAVTQQQPVMAEQRVIHWRYHQQQPRIQ